MRRAPEASSGGPAVAGGEAAGRTEALELRRVLLNGVSLLFAYVLPRLATFGAVVVAARMLGVAAFGAYGAAAALAVILSITATLGMMQMLVRDLAQHPADAQRLLATANVAKLGSGALMLATLAAAASLLLGYPPELTAAALLLGASYAVGSHAENYGAYFQAAERMGVWLQAQALFGLVTATLGITLVVTTRSIVWFCVAPVAGQLAALAWLLFRAPTSLRRAWTAPWPLVRRLLGSLLPFAIGFIALTAYHKVDILLVDRWRGSGEAGLYAAAYKFVDIAHSLALVVATAVYPRLARGAVIRGIASSGRPGHEPASGWAAARTLELLLLGGVPAAGVLWLLREPVVSLLFGPAFAAAAPVLGLLVPVLPVLAMNALGTFVLAASHRMGRVAALYGGALFLNVAANAVLIPAFGARGAAAAMLLSESALGLGMLGVLHRFAASAPAPRVRAAALAAAGFAAAAPWLGAPAAVLACVYVCVVVLFYWSVNVVPGHELALLRRAVRP